MLFPGMTVEAGHFFRVTRDAVDQNAAEMPAPIAMTTASHIRIEKGRAKRLIINSRSWPGRDIG